VFSRLVYQRLRDRLEEHQPPDQVGFRRDHSINDAFIVLETVCGKSFEWQLPCWIASLDLKKAFDRIEYPALFEALRQQGIEEHYIALLAAMYSEQTGRVLGSTPFNIERGVKQGDVISPMLFSAGLELALSRWKATLAGRGLDIGQERLSNIRYADDLLIYASSNDDLCFMVDSLCIELRRIGLSLNASKTRIFTTTPVACPFFIELDSEMVQVVIGNEAHMYLGRRLPGDLRCRAQVELAHRSQVAWSKLNERRHILTDRHISISKRLRLFDAVVSPTVLSVWSCGSSDVC